MSEVYDYWSKEDWVAHTEELEKEIASMQKVVDAAREVAKTHKSGHAVMCHHTDTGEFVCALCEAISNIKEK